jgi:Nif-specific regulatory protein
MPTLLVKEGPDKGKTFEVDADVITLGRDVENDVTIQHQTVSRFHARIVLERGAWFLTDLDSRNGTFRNDDKVTRDELANLDEVRLGDVVLVWVADEEAGEIELLARGAEQDEPAITRTMKVQSYRLLRKQRTPGPEELREENQRLVSLLELAQTAGSARTLPELFDKLNDSLDETLAPDRVVPILRERDGRLVPHMRSRSRVDRILSKVGVSTTIVQHSLKSEEAVLSSRTSADERFSGSESVARHKISTAMCAPLKIGESLLGVIYVDRLDESEAFHPRDLEYLSAVAPQVAVAVENIRAYQRLAAQASALEKEIKGQYNIVGNSPAIRRTFDFITKAAPTDAGVLITGESGTGKELVARAIHFSSPRRDESFEAVNCAAMSTSLIESELFGHVKGAFTGAVADRPGRFELASGGSIFLDEIGDLPLECQTKLLRVLEESKIRRVGDVKDRTIDVRVIAATNCELQDAVGEQKFRKDLFYRLNVLKIALPPLRERGEDIEILTRHFLREFSERCGRQIAEIDPAVLDVFRAYHWPGNVRELRNVIERMVIMSEGDRLGMDVLPFELQGAAPASATAAAAPAPLCSVGEMERRHILGVLDATKGNKKRAAAILGIDRSTLYAKLKSYGIGT